MRQVTRVWPSGKTSRGVTEWKIFVNTADGGDGCLYLTGNPWHAKGSVEGDVTAEEWKEAKRLSIRDGKWHAYEVPKSAPVIVAPQTPVMPTVTVAPTPRRTVVTTLVATSYTRPGTFVHVTLRDRTERALVCVACGYVRADDEDDHEEGYYTDYAEPTVEEQSAPDYQRIIATIAATRAANERAAALGEARRQADLDEMNAARAARGERSLDEAAASSDMTPTEFASWLFAGGSDN